MSEQAVIVKAVARAGVLKLVDEGAYTRGVRGMKPGDGEVFVIRIEREAEAYSLQHLRFYWGQVVTPVSEYAGYSKEEFHRMLKAECLPEGKSSITELDRDEFKDYVMHADIKAREWCPDAFALMEDRRIS